MRLERDALMTATIGTSTTTDDWTHKTRFSFLCADEEFEIYDSLLVWFAFIKVMGTSRDRAEPRQKSLATVLKDRGSRLSKEIARSHVIGLDHEPWAQRRKLYRAPAIPWSLWLGYQGHSPRALAAQSKFEKRSIYWYLITESNSDLMQWWRRSRSLSQFFALLYAKPQKIRLPCWTSLVWSWLQANLAIGHVTSRTMSQRPMKSMIAWKKESGVPRASSPVRHTKGTEPRMQVSFQ